MELRKANKVTSDATALLPLSLEVRRRKREERESSRIEILRLLVGEGRRGGGKREEGNKK